MDGYLTLVAKDENLKMNTFQSLVEALPKEARFCDDNLYRAIDMYLKVSSSISLIVSRDNVFPDLTNSVSY